MNLHLIDDEKFINGAIELFEKYDKSNNLFIVHRVKGGFKYLNAKEQILTLNFSEINIGKTFNSLIETKRIDKIFVHYLTPMKAFLVNNALKKFNLKSYWIFYGADLYSRLHEYYNYPLFDFKKKQNLFSATKPSRIFFYIKRVIQHRRSENKELRNFFKSLNFFCFWNNYDFILFNRYFKTKAKFLYFVYFNVFDYSQREIPQRKELNILVNNSASIYGNHLTILKRILQVDEGKVIDKIITPLSYGNESIKKTVINYGSQNFPKRFEPLLDFMRKDEYYQLLDSVSVAFFGARRQEAAGNVFYLLKNGVKIFLRKDNNMLEFLRDKGFTVFDFDNEFRKIEDLEPLGAEEINKNRLLFHATFNDQNEAVSMTQLIGS